MLVQCHVIKHMYTIMSVDVSESLYIDVWYSVYKTRVMKHREKVRVCVCGLLIVPIKRKLGLVCQTKRLNGKRSCRNMVL